MEEFSLIVGDDESGMRLDAFVAARLKSCSRSFATSLIRHGCIRVDGNQRKPSYKLHQSENVSGQLPPPVPADLVPEPMALDILFEDDSLIVLNKPAGIVVHPAAGHYQGTLVHGLLHHCPDLTGIGGIQRPGIVHRLDRDTSGVMLVAKNADAHQELSRQFKEREIAKSYLALVHGVPSSNRGRIDMTIGRHPVDRKKMTAGRSDGRDAVTLWRIKEEYDCSAALLEVDLKTGRTHQIRVHCQAMGYPIVGDPTYGPKRAVRKQNQHNKELHDILSKAKRQMLHAFRLSFIHPKNRCQMVCEAPLASDMIELVDALRRIVLQQ